MHLVPEALYFSLLVFLSNFESTLGEICGDKINSL